MSLANIVQRGWDADAAADTPEVRGDLGHHVAERDLRREQAHGGRRRYQRNKGVDLKPKDEQEDDRDGDQQDEQRVNLHG